MAKNLPDERLVYLALKGVFAGNEAQLRQEKKIRTQIQKHQNQANIRNLIEEHKLERVCHVAKILLQEQVFMSTLKAKIRFPEVFEVSPTQTVERAISETEAARNEDAAIQSVIEGRHDEAFGHNGKFESDNACKLQSKATGGSLYPVYLPFDVQHGILVTIQSSLEKSCFNFAQKHLGGYLQREGWDCAEAVELNRWPRVFLTHPEVFDSENLKDLGKPLEDLLNSITQLRHAAVHRLHITANRTLDFIFDAELLVNLLQDVGDILTVSSMRRQFQRTLEDVERNKDLLESRLTETKKRFAEKRAELQSQEQEAIENSLKEDKDYILFAGKSLKESLNEPATAIQSPASVEDEVSSSTDIDDHAADEVESSWKCVD